MKDYLKLFIFLDDFNVIIFYLNWCIRMVIYVLEGFLVFGML